MDASLRPECLPNTRLDMLSLIKTSLTAPSDSGDTGNILWLHGVAGGQREGSGPSSVIRTIAYWLARSNAQVAQAICAVIDVYPNIADIPIDIQFQKLLLEPLAAAKESIKGPIIVILDALDECGNSDARERLVSILANDFRKLPSVVRFFITSRPDLDIAATFLDQPWITKIRLDITEPSTWIPHGQGTQKSTIWPDVPRGLFIWASTATKLILNAPNANRSLDTLLLQKSSNLDYLYSAALRSTGLWDESSPTFAPDAPAVLAAVVLGKVSMSAETVDKLLGLEQHSSRQIFRQLGCVLHEPDGLSRILHASFGDYITDPLRSARPTRTFPMLTYMASPDRIPSHVSYASRFWATHLQVTDPDNKLLENIQELMYNKFPFWLEVLSALQETSIAIDVLTNAGVLVKKYDGPLTDFVTDAIKFVLAFAPAIAHSAPQIYLSALSLAPSQSKVAKTFSGWLIRKVELQSSVVDRWPRLQTTIEGHSRGVFSVAFSHNGDRIVSGSADGTVRVWDARTGVLVAGPLEAHSEVNCVAFSPDGEYIVSGSDDTKVRVWNARLGLVSAVLEGHSKIVTAVAFSRDGGRIASASCDCTVRIWDTRTGVLAAQPFLHPRALWSVSFSPDGVQVVTGSADNMLRIWAIPVVAPFERHIQSPQSPLAFSPADGDILDATTDALILGPLQGHQDRVTSVSFSPDGGRVVSGSNDGTVRVWDAQTGAPVVRPFEGHSARVKCVAFSPDRERIVSGSKDDTVRVWDARTGALVTRPFRGHNDSVCSISFSPDGGKIVSGSADHTLRIWDVHLDLVAEETFVRWAQRSGSLDDTVCIWDARTGALVAGPLEGHSGAYVSASISRHGRYIVSGSDDSALRISDVHMECSVAALLAGYVDAVVPPALSPERKPFVSTGTSVGPVAGTFGGHRGSLAFVSFSPDDTQIVSTSYAGTVRVWDARTGALVAGPFKGHTDRVTCVSLSPDGGRIISGYRDGTVRVWDVQTGAVVAGPFEGHEEEICSVAFSPDGEQIVSASRDTTVRVWNTRSGCVAAVLKGHTRRVDSVTFSPDGKWMASGSQDRMIRVWGVEGAIIVPRLVLEGHSSIVRSIAFSPNSQQIVSGSWDRTIRVFELDPDDRHRPFGHGSTLKDGWIVNSSSELIVWIPPWLRDGLYFPHTSLVISASGTAKLDFSRFVHGTSWEECVDPKVRSV
ncbi:WD40 repeat-like protein [Mycena venus]|uniref:WD40 repeat-like protein n=1 Tax=Mycena venus TaxID=2733690 RepID=A0A8H6YI60_9AGAR|nr:WD40 repeat-like protein [Mycena venus]